MLFIFSFVSAQPPFQDNINGLQIFTSEFAAFEVDQNYTSHLHVALFSNGIELDAADYDCYLHLYNDVGSHILQTNYSDDSNGIEKELAILAGNFSEVGEYAFRIGCEDTLGEFGGEVSGVILVTYTGEHPPTGFDGRFILLLCFVLLFVGLAYLQKEINFEKWYQKILTKYNHKNFFRIFISKLGFFFMNNPFSLFYMIGLFIMLLMYDVTRVYLLTSAHSVMEVLVMIYLFGMFFLFIELLGDIHEFFSRIRKDIAEMGWGLERDPGLLDTDKITGARGR
jgi:hypothetical protein